MRLCIMRTLLLFLTLKCTIKTCLRAQRSVLSLPCNVPVTHPVSTGDHRNSSLDCLTPLFQRARMVCTPHPPTAEEGERAWGSLKNVIFDFPTVLLAGSLLENCVQFGANHSWEILKKEKYSRWRTRQYGRYNSIMWWGETIKFSSLGS